VIRSVTLIGMVQRGRDGVVYTIAKEGTNQERHDSLAGRRILARIALKKVQSTTGPRWFLARLKPPYVTQ